MLKKTLKLLKENPSIIIFYFFYTALIVVITTIMANNLNINIDAADTTQIFNFLKHTLGWWIIIGVIFTIFMSGWGNMIAHAVNTDKAAPGTFFKGINEFILRMLITNLLLIIICIGFIIAITLISIPLFFIMESTVSSSGAVTIGIIYGLVIALIFILLYPFFMLWYPAIFVDNIGIMEAFQRSVRTSKKCYWTLVLTLFVSALPEILYIVITEVMNYGETSNALQLTSPVYWVYIGINILVFITVSVFTYVLYKQKNSDKVKSVNS